jgi:hypothetical protein
MEIQFLMEQQKEEDYVEDLVVDGRTMLEQTGLAQTTDQWWLPVEIAMYSELSDCRLLKITSAPLS